MIKIEPFSRGVIFVIIFIVFYQQSLIIAQVSLNRNDSNRSELVDKKFSKQSPSDRYIIRVNVGGERWIDSRRQEWLADQRYQSGSYGYLGFSDTYTTKETISGTENQYLYQSERFKLFGYRFDVPNGNYEIVLHFAEIYHNKPGKRLMDIKIEDKVVLKDLDLYAKVGNNAALVFTFNTKELGFPILDKRIDIELISKQDDTKLSAIEVMELPEQTALLKIEPQELNFGLEKNSLNLTIINLSSNKVQWSFKKKPFPRWLQIPVSTTGILLLERTENLVIRVNRIGMASGIHQDSLIIAAPGFEQKIPITITVAGAAKLSLITPTLDFKDSFRNLPCILTNEGGSPLNWSSKTKQLPLWIRRVYPMSGTIAIGESVFVNISIIREKLPPGEHMSFLSIADESNSQNVLLKVTIPRQQTRYVYVNDSAVGANNGSSWENAFIRIKDAIASVGKLDRYQHVEIWVAEGNYFEHDIYVPSGIQLYGGFQGDEAFREERQQIWNHPTIIDGQKRGRCFECEHRTVVDGFVIQNGRDWGTGEGKGAAILTYDADVQIRNNLICNNVDSWAGAVFIEGFDLKKKVQGVSPVIERNVFINNLSNYCAAAIEIRGSAATVRHNTIVDNKGYGLEIQTLLGPYQQVIYGDFYNNIITNNVRHKEDDVWAEARKVTNYCYVGKRWSLWGDIEPGTYGEGNIFGDIVGKDARFIDHKNGNFRLKIDSPCINAGNPKSGTDPDGTRADLGVFPLNQNQPELEVSPTKLNFGSKIEKQYLIIQAYGGKPVQWHVAAYSSARDIFSVNPSSGILSNGEEAKLNVTVNRNGLSDGSYEGYIAVMTCEQSHEIKISLLVNNSKPEIKIEPDLIHVELISNDPNIETKQIYINNSGYGDFAWQSQKKFDSDWVRLSPISGKAGETLTLSFDISKLEFGGYHEDVLIVSNQAINYSTMLPVDLKVKPDKFYVEIEAENSPSLPNFGWRVVQNDGATCTQAMKSFLDAPQDSTRLDYEFFVPEGVDYIYVFAEVDVNKSLENDSFWVMVNGYDPCTWDFINSKYDGWNRAWIYHKLRDKQHMFVTIPGVNTLNVFTREKGGFINWFVITNDPNINIKTYRFGSNSNTNIR